MTAQLDSAGAPLVVLVDASSPSERELVDAALREVGDRSATVVPLRGSALAGPLAGADPETVVTAVRVAWAPRRTAEGEETAGQRRWSPAGTFLPRRPPRPFQAAALRRDRERARVVIAESATLAELAERWNGTGSLPDFVAHQAGLALDRAERTVVGSRAKVPRQVSEAIEASPEFAAEVSTLAARLDRPEEHVRAEAVAALDGLMGAMDPVAVELFTFVDRGDSAQARRALEPAVQRLRDGLSLVIAPEGTRSATPTLGPFKKGAFHVAMQAGVPIVPVVIRNAGELMWRGASTISPGTVQVRVLPPIPTTDWTVDELDERVAEVRGQYLEALGNWSGREERPVVATEHAGDDTGATPPDAPLDWGVSAQMNPLETAMWRAEASDARLRANVTLLELLEPAPDWERLPAAHEWASRMVPRMRQRVLEPALGIGSPAG